MRAVQAWIGSPGGRSLPRLAARPAHRKGGRRALYLRRAPSNSALDPADPPQKVLDYGSGRGRCSSIRAAPSQTLGPEVPRGGGEQAVIRERDLGFAYITCQ